jgi:pSer/pThr/pTyr-binding forkhead associated (FHA) protein
MAKNVLVLKHFESPKEAGVYFRLVCLTGANKGESYVILGNRIVIGRSDKADIKLNDTKASREHAEITKVGANYVITDLGSQNGIIVNEKKLTQSQLSESDKVIIGQTVFKFAKVEVSKKNSVIAEKPEDGNGLKKSLVPVILLAGVFIYFILDEEKPVSEDEPKKTKVNAASFQDVSAEYISALKKRQASEDKAVKEKLNIIYQKGIREFREGNYFRAIEEFQLALIVAPGDSYAEYLLRKTKEKLDKTIEEYTVMAERDSGALKYQSAIVAYCSILRLLATVPSDDRYKNAETRIKDLEFKLGLEQGATECLKKPRTDQ